MTDESWQDICVPLMLRDQAAGIGPWRLRRVLLTTFGQPDHRLLTDHLLPLWLGLGRPPEADGDAAEHRLDLLGALGTVDGVIIADAHPAPGWLWHRLPCVRTGMAKHGIGRIAQHAKLWLFAFERIAADGKTTESALEICVSSTNLSWDAVHGQTQAAWRFASILDPTPRRRDVRKAEPLLRFLDALRADVDPAISERIQPWRSLISRCTWPDDLVGFVASVPGVRTADAWGARTWPGTAKRKREPTCVRVLTPSLGMWTDDCVKNWCDAVNISPAALSVVRPGLADLGRPPLLSWRPSWKAPEVQLRALFDLNMARERLCSSSKIAQGAGAGDARWFHGKVYEFIDASGRVIERYVGSANFSPAAWGRPARRRQVAISNYEFGVVIRPSCRSECTPWIDVKPIRQFKEHAASRDTDTPETEPSPPWSGWTWNGREIIGQIATAATSLHVEVVLHRAVGKPLRRRISVPPGTGNTHRVTFSCATPVVSIEVVWEGGLRETVVPVDVRPHQDRSANIDAPGQQVDQSVLLRFLLKQYGAWDDGDSDKRLGASDDDPRESTAVGIDAHGVDYSQSWLVVARQLGEVIDGWVTTQAAAGNDAKQVEHHRGRGRLLAELMSQKAEQLRLAESAQPLLAMVWSTMAEELHMRCADRRRP